ncbi:MAG: hypothetical protein KGL39_59540 [Patescibacteria group bacterium]|nr:hypothetical protein [Patescibacteria group bacterium]
MTDDCWHILVRRYADGRDVCNCGEAWYARIGDQLTDWDGHGWRSVVNGDPMRCAYGCRANQLSCKHEIAQRVVEELLCDAAYVPS